jgi:small subunit ribosomal protein S4e
MSHLKRLAAPKTWKIKRKERKWIARPKPGPHTVDKALTPIFILRDQLDYAKTSKEVKKILTQEDFLVDNIIRKDDKFPVGLMDVIFIKSANQHFRILFNKKGKLVLHPIKKEESNLKPLKIIRKRTIKKKKTQLTFFDGRTILTDKKDYKVGDTLIFDISTKAVKEHLKLEKGSLVYITDGTKIGTIGIIESIEESSGLQPKKIVFTRGKDKFETLKEYAFVIGKNKPIISLPKDESDEKN